MKKLDTLIAEEYKNILEEQHILKSSGPMVLKEWKKSKQILNEEEEKDVSVRYRDEEFGRRKSGEKSKFSPAEAYEIFGNPDHESGWNTTEEKKLFLKLWNWGAIPSHVLDELYFLEIPTESGDLYTFEPSMELYSYQTMGAYDFEFTNDQIKITNKIPAETPPSLICTPSSPSDKCKPGTISKFAWVTQGSKYGYIQLPSLGTLEPEKEKAPEKENKTLDTIQTVLDWLGLVPYIGDAIDAINAIIYFIRGKYLEGALSLVAIIPFVGSVLAISLKTGLKAIKGSTKIIKGLFKTKGAMKNSKTAMKAFKSAALQGKVTGKQLKALAYFGPGMAKKIKRAKKYINKVPVGEGTKKQFLSKMDEMANGLKNMGKSASEVEKLKMVEKLARKNIDKAVNASKLRKYLENILPKMNSGISKALDNRMGRLFGFEFATYGKNIAKNLDARLISKLTDNPTNAFIKAAGAGTTIKKALRQSEQVILNKGLVTPKELKKLLGRTKSASNFDQRAFQLLKQVDPIAANKIGKDIGETVVSQNGQLVKAYREASSTNFEKLKTMIDPTMATTITRARKKLLTNYALWYNEISDLLEKIGADDDGIDNVNGVVLANLYYGIREYAPDSISTAVGTAASAVKKFVITLKNWGQPDLLKDAGVAFGILNPGPLVAKNWTSSYPGMTAEAKVLQTFKANPGNEDNVLNNYIAIMNADGKLEGDGSLLTQEDVQRIYNEYMETV